MLTPEIIELIAVSATATGGVITGVGVILKKVGILHFGKKENGNGKKPVPMCGMHVEIRTSLEEVKITQVRNVERHKQHTKELKRGTENFKSLFTEMISLKEGVGILMDRTGGRPENWRKG